MIECSAQFRFDDDQRGSNTHVYTQAGLHSVQIVYGSCSLIPITLYFDLVVPIDLTIKTTVTAAPCNTTNGKIIVTSPVGANFTYTFDDGALTSTNMFSAAAGNHSVGVNESFPNSLSSCRILKQGINVPLTPNTINNVNDPDVITCDASLDGQIKSTVCNPVNTLDCTQNCTVTKYKFVGTPAYITVMGTCLVASDGVSWQWYLKREKLKGSTKQIIFPTTYGDYTVAVTNAKGCTSLSDPMRSENDFVDNCPQIHKNFGAACDDGNPSTINDIVRNDCKCRGGYYSPNMTAKCPSDFVVVSTDKYGTVINWQTVFTTNCNDKTIDVKQTSGYYSGYPFPVNDASAIEYVATDMCGNKTSCRFIVRTTPLMTPNVEAPVSEIAVKPTSRDKIAFNLNGLSPNPVTNELNLNMTSDQEREVSFQIINSLGSVMMSETKALTIGENQLKLDVSQLQAGFYFVCPQTPEGKTVPTKFVKF